MNPMNSISELKTLLEFREKAARRNEILFTILFVAVLAISVLYFRLNFQIDWLVLVFPLLSALAAGLSLLQVSRQFESPLVIELIEAPQRMNRVPQCEVWMLSNHQGYPGGRPTTRWSGPAIQRQVPEKWRRVCAEPHIID